MVIDYYGDLNRTGKWIANPYNTYSWDKISQQQAESFLHIYKFVYIRKDGAVAAAHEFGHVVLYLRSGGKSYTHNDQGVNSEIGKRVRQMTNKLDK